MFVNVRAYFVIGQTHLENWAEDAPNIGKVAILLCLPTRGVKEEDIPKQKQSRITITSDLSTTLQTTPQALLHASGRNGNRILNGLLISDGFFKLRHSKRREEHPFK